VCLKIVPEYFYDGPAGQSLKQFSRGAQKKTGDMVSWQAGWK